MTPSTPDSGHQSPSGTPDHGQRGTKNSTLETEARNAKHEVNANVREKAEAGQHRITEEANTLSEAIDAAASNLESHDRDGLARYAHALSSQLSDAATRLEDRSVDELASDAKRLARKNPAQFMLGSIAIGFGLSRFLKASSDHDHHTHDNADHAAKPSQSSTGADTPIPQRERNPSGTLSTPTDENDESGRNSL